MAYIRDARVVMVNDCFVPARVNTREGAHGRQPLHSRRSNQGWDGSAAIILGFGSECSAVHLTDQAIYS